MSYLREYQTQAMDALRERIAEDGESTMDEEWMDQAPSTEAIGTQFAAQLSGTCAEDGDPIEPGQMIQRTPDGYAHTFCLRAAIRPVVWE